MPGFRMKHFVTQLDARLEHDGFHSHNAKARALGVDPATWSRARRGIAHFPLRVVQAGIVRYPALAKYLSAYKAAA